MMLKNLRTFRWCMYLVIIILLNGYNIQDAFAGTKKSYSASIQGSWGEGLKSISDDIPLTVSIDKSTISIHSKSLRSDITIRVSKGDEVIYEQIVLAPDTQNIYINLDNAENGKYRIDLLNQWGDHLYEDFDIQK